ncbi:MAG: ATP-dependent helicase [Oribacterium sp.]|nr:ATP-dependent helicase [Oribacterium sp.]
MGYSEDQLKAIEHGQGPAMVLAGPGSGKTTVITRRILQLLKNGVPASEILVITFTKDAALEMEGRFRKLLLEDQRLHPNQQEFQGNVTFGTFHSVFFQILRLTYQLTAENIIKDRDKKLILREILEEENVDAGYDAEFFRMLLSEISRMKNSGGSLVFHSSLLEDEKFHRIFQTYTARLRAQRLLDFDDMLSMCYELLTTNKEARHKWQSVYRYILVDEFQDINPVQYAVTRILALPENNLFIVGDDDQSIYHFRGADPSIMLGFPRDYPATKTIVLGKNFRSRTEIVRFSGNLIRKNKKRYEKRVDAVRGQGGSVLLYHVDSMEKQSQAVLSLINASIRAGVPKDKIAILFRATSQARPLLPILMKQGIPYVMKEKVKNIYESVPALDMIAYLRLATGTGARRDFLRIMNRPVRYIKRAAVQERNMSFEALLRFYQDKPWMLERLRTLQTDLRAIAMLPTAAALVYIRKKIGYENFLKETDNARFRDHLEILDEITETATEHPDPKEWLRFTEDMGELLSQQGSHESTNQTGAQQSGAGVGGASGGGLGKTGHGQTQNEDTGAIRLMTYHASKGLEFDTVILPDCCEGVTPYNKAVSQDEIEEERRSFFVACTRAKEKLHILFTDLRYSKSCTASRFITEGRYA